MMPKLAMSFISLYKTEAIVLGYVGSELCVFRTLSALIFFPFLLHSAELAMSFYCCMNSSWQ
jgi:hypothetical protein